MPETKTILIIGGGAAGVFAAIACAEAAPGCRVVVLEKTAEFLAKVRISGGGRCNVTHACFDPQQLIGYYPRGGAALRGPFAEFQPRDTIDWFARHGVRLKTEPDGRMFPVTDSSQTIVDCLLRAARAAGIELLAHRPVGIIVREGAGFRATLGNGETLRCDRVMLATGGCRTAAGGGLAVSLGHSLVPPVPSLFAFQIREPWLNGLAGISLDNIRASVPAHGLRQSGPLVITHKGLSGPAILKLSAWGARELHGDGYRFALKLDWLPEVRDVAGLLESNRAENPARLVINRPVGRLPARLWEQLVLTSGVAADTRWAGLSKSLRHRLAQQLSATDLCVSGRSLNTEEFVTCGGIPLKEVSFKTMESRVCPNLFFGGELLDIDGLTGGFNFQAAWATGWIAGRAMGQG